jgi:hypothetical protein
MTIEETKVYKKAWELHEGNLGPAGAIFARPRDSCTCLVLASGRTFMNTSRMPKPRLVAAASEA